MSSKEELLDQIQTHAGKTWIENILCSPQSTSFEGTNGYWFVGRTCCIHGEWGDVAIAVDKSGLTSEQVVNLSLDAARALWLKTLGFDRYFDLEDQDVYQRVCAIAQNLTWIPSDTEKVYGMKAGDNFWLYNNPKKWMGVFCIRDHRFFITMTNESEGKWQMGWAAFELVPEGNGLFEHAATQLKLFTRDFLEQEQPVELNIYGLGKNRNSFYAANCSQWCPEGFETTVLTSSHDTRKDEIYGVKLHRVELTHTVKL